MSLEEKLRRVAERSAQQQLDWDARRIEWVERVKQLCDEVELWLKPYQDKGYLTVERSKKTLSEEFLGRYAIDELKIFVGENTIVLEPLARNVIGAHGRIDFYLRGYKSDALLLLLLEDGEGTLRWEVWKSKDTGFRKPFSRETFESILEQWL